MKKKSTKKKLRAIILLSSLVIGTALMIVSFFLPPQGVIDPSVSSGVGMLLTFTAIYEALLGDKIIRFTKGNTSIYIGDKDNPSDDADDTIGDE